MTIRESMSSVVHRDPPSEPVRAVDKQAFPSKRNRMDKIADWASLESEASKLARNSAMQAARQKNAYIGAVEKSQGNDIFKYLLLVKTAALDEHIAQTRTQAEAGFRLSKIAAYFGFFLLFSGFVLAILASVITQIELSAAILAASAGALAEVAAAVIFLLYNRTLQQLNRFHDKLVTTQQMTMSFLASSTVADEAMRDQSKVSLANSLMAITNANTDTVINPEYVNPINL
ncbi:MAG: hypothetical protein SVY53_03935 [Chloroflexota bacterium]|nr:hypothetical protein [Chloroflexota bacterium]